MTSYIRHFACDDVLADFRVVRIHYHVDTCIDAEGYGFFPVGSDMLAWTGTLLIDAEMTIMVNAPACMQSLNGLKYFSLRSSGAMYAGVLSLPEAAAP